MKEAYDTGEVLQRRLQLAKEINSYPVDIDRTAFKKSPQEKIECKKAKSEWKKSQKLKAVTIV